MTTDRSQVGLTSRANRQLAELQADTPYFEDESDVYRCAVAVGLALDVDPREMMERMSGESFVTKFRVVKATEDDSLTARLDTPDRQLARLICCYSPELSDAPYRYSQYLAVAGISYLHGQIVENGRSLIESIRMLTRND